MPRDLAEQSELVSALAGAVGASHVITDRDVLAGYECDWTRRWRGAALAAVRPGSTDEVADVIRLCARRRVAIVTQGGNTGLVGGGVPGPHPASAIVLSTVRLTRLDPVDTAAGQVTAGAGVTLARLQDAAAASGLAFAVDFAARDSATVGGMVATNAGGTRVIRYGPMRAQVVGLEAVLADGSVVSRLSGLVKDNTGYDLSQLLVGSEGTIGVVTAARLRLVPAAAHRCVALVGLRSTVHAMEVLDVLRRRADGLEAVEVFYEDGLELVCAHVGLPRPLPDSWPAYVAAECAGRTDPADALASALAAAGLHERATAIATEPAGRQRLWAYRERHTEAISSVGVPHKLDVALPAGRLAEFETTVRRRIEELAPGSRVLLFGHLGDGNLHVNVVGPPAEDETVDDAVLRLVASMEGSISAEHGIGRAKARWLHLARSPAELAAMTAIKRALDPGRVLNPGVLLPEA